MDEDFDGGVRHPNLPPIPPPVNRPVPPSTPLPDPYGQTQFSQPTVAPPPTGQPASLPSPTPRSSGSGGSGRGVLIVVLVLVGLVAIAGFGLVAALLVFRSSDDIGSSEAIGSSEITDSSVTIDDAVSEDIGVENYGDDERLDLLYEDCGAGDDRACDILFWVSGVSTGYEAFAMECGGRGLPVSGWCTPDIVFGPSDEVAADDPGLLTQGALCDDGDLTACDFVYQVSPVGSDVELVGFTCGGRVPDGAIPDCRTELG